MGLRGYIATHRDIVVVVMYLALMTDLYHFLGVLSHCRAKVSVLHEFSNYDINPDMSVTYTFMHLFEDVRTFTFGDTFQERPIPHSVV